MKTLFLGLSAAVVTAIVAAGAVAGQPDIRPLAIAGEGDACALPGAEADGDIVLNGGLGTITSLVERDSKVTLQCKGTGIVNDSGSGQSYSGFPCLVPTSGGTFQTSDSRATVSASGNARLTCTYHR
jgi:hypothetical protein